MAPLGVRLLCVVVGDLSFSFFRFYGTLLTSMFNVNVNWILVPGSKLLKSKMSMPLDQQITGSGHL